MVAPELLHLCATTVSMKCSILFACIITCFFLTEACNTNTSHSSEEAVEKKGNHTHLTTAEVPPAVLDAFHTRYPHASGVIWETATEGGSPSYKAKWKAGDKKWKAEFAQDGHFIKEKQN